MKILKHLGPHKKARAACLSPCSRGSFIFCPKANQKQEEFSHYARETQWYLQYILAIESNVILRS